MKDHFERFFGLSAEDNNNRSNQELGIQKDTTIENVNRWFSNNTFQARDFERLDLLLAAKREQGLTISLALPTLNEAETIGNILGQVQEFLVERFPLLDEIVVIDSDSTDDTCDIARSYDVPVYTHQELLPDYGARMGKGEALWKSLYVTTGDIVLWCDTDIKNFHPRFVYGLLGPLLNRPSIQFVKGFYRRPLAKNSSPKGLSKNGGGRVTELTARPLLNMFYPELSGIIQPLAGEYGGRRKLLEKLTFTSGYGVETSLLIDAYEQAGLDQIAQVDLIERVHHNQSIEDLSKMSFAIIQTIFQRLEVKYGHSKIGELNQLLNLSMRRVQQDPDRMYLDSQELAEPQRPPMNRIPEYRNRYKTPEMPLTGIKAGNLLRDVLNHPDDIFLVPGSLVSRS